MLRFRHNPRTARRLIATGLLATGMIAASVFPAQADELSDKQAEAAQLAKKLDALDSKLMDLSAEGEAASYELSKVEEQVAEAQVRADDAQAEVERRTVELRNFSVDAYVSGGSAPQFDALLTADGDTVAQKQAYVKATTGSRADALDNLSAAKREAEDEIDDLEAKQSEAQAIKDDIEAKKDQAAAAAQEQRTLNSRVQGELATLVAEKRQQEAEAAARAAEAQRAAATVTTTGGNQSNRGGGGTTGGGGGGGGGTATPAPPVYTAPAPDPGPAPAPPPGGGGAIGYALSKIGSPYVWGAEGPNSFDCSGLVRWAYLQVGISLPHYSGAQYQMTTRVSRGDLQPGDLVFWGPGGSDHVAIYMGGNQLVHAFGSGGGVATSRLDGWWKPPSGYGRL